MQVCAVDGDGATFCAGTDSEPERAFEGVVVKSIDTNGRATCVVTEAGKVRCIQHVPDFGSPLLNIPLGLRDE